MIDCYVYPGSNVLKNKFGITDYKSWKEFEGIASLTRIVELRENSKFKVFDFDTLCKIHQYLFQDVYEWAGKPRTIAISKGNTLFCPPEYIISYANELFEDLKLHNYYHNYTNSQLVPALGQLFCDINMLHPFREGNGRTQREFFYHFAKSLSYELDLAIVDKVKYINVTARSPVDSKPVIDIIKNNLIHISDYTR